MINEKQVKNILDSYGVELEDVENGVVYGVYRPSFNHITSFLTLYNEWVKANVLTEDGLLDWFYYKSTNEDWFMNERLEGEIEKNIISYLNMVI